MIRTREQLLNWLEENAPRPCIRRAIREGQRVENFGGFKQVLPEKFSPGWIVRINSQFGKMWNVGVWFNQEGRLITDTLDVVPWNQRVGKKPNSLYSGDFPELYQGYTNDPKR